MGIINQGIQEELFSYLCHSVAESPYYLLLGINLREIGQGWAKLEVEPQDRHTNPLGLIHGGLVMSLIDAAMGNAVRSLGVKGVTVDCQTSFFSPAGRGINLLARGEVQKIGNNLAFTRADVYSDDKIVAQGNGTFYIVGSVL